MEDTGEASTNNHNNNKSISNPYLAVNNQARWKKAAAQHADSSFELLLPVRQERRKESLEESHHDLKLPAEPGNENHCSTTLDEAKEGATKASSNTTTAPLPTPNTGLAYWERLPSNNLTFGSAEILTVEECVKYKDFYRGRAVRVTGLLRRRGFVEQPHQDLPQVTLELVHIETTRPSFPRTADKTPVKQTMHPTTPTNSKSSSLSDSKGSSHQGPFKTPTTLGGAGVQNSLVRNVGNSTNVLSSKRKRPWFATTNNNSNKKSPLPPSRLSKPSITTTTTTSPELFLLQVLVDPELPHLSELVPSETTKVTVWGTMLEDGSIQARFVNLVDAQMDMNLYMTALLRRRRWLYQRHHKQQQQQQLVQPASTPSSPSGPIQPRGTKDSSGTKEEKVEETILIQGCGPPPYEKLLE